MADIDLVPRTRSSAWIWWLVAIVIVALILMWALSGSQPQTTGTTGALLPQFTPGTAAVFPTT